MGASTTWRIESQRKHGERCIITMGIVVCRSVNLLNKHIMNKSSTEVLSTDTAYKHIWVKGEWYREKGSWGQYRDDHCALCKCLKHLHRETKEGEERVNGYR